MTDHVVGVDLGTEGVRVGLYDLGGRPCGRATEPYPTSHPAPGWAEQNPDDWWRAMCIATQRLLSESGARPESVIALGFAATSCTVLLTAIDGTPLHPALLWMDIRAHDDGAEIGALDSLALRVGAGAVANPEWMLPKARWLKRYRSEVYEDAAVICEMVDWIGHRLTGRWTMGRQHAIAKAYYHAAAGWPHELYTAAGLDDALARFPAEVLEPGSLHGDLTDAAAADLGVRSGTAVAQGGSDAFVGALGLGVIESGQMALITGSSHLQLIQTDEDVRPTGLHGAYADLIVPGLHVVEGGQTSTGSTAAWWRQLLASAGTGLGYAELDQRAESIPPGADGLVLVDHWQGSRTPNADPAARGVLRGMTLHHDLGHVWRAVLEGVAIGTAANLAEAAASGVEVDEIRVCGGVCNSSLWLQIHADATGIPLVTTEVPEAVGLGSAILAATATRAHPSLVEASRTMVRAEAVVEPQPEAGGPYRKLLERYRDTYRGLRAVDDERSRAEAMMRHEVTAAGDRAALLTAGRRSLDALARGLADLADQLAPSFAAAAELVVRCRGHVVVSGAGTSAAVAARLAHLLTVVGAPSFFVSPGDSAHGAAGALTDDDMLVAISKGGESEEVNALARVAADRGVPIVVITHAESSTLASLGTIVIAIEVPPDLDAAGYIALGSSLASAAVGDALCFAVFTAKGFDESRLRAIHPGGAVGKALGSRHRPGPESV